jgi:hypothetical protein
MELTRQRERERERERENVKRTHYKNRDCQYLTIKALMGVDKYF